MIQQNNIKKIVEGKVCCILAHGKSIETLESRIEEFRNFDVVWCGMNYFNPTEEIIKKINKQFKIVFDCSMVKNAELYEITTRLPRLRKYLSRLDDNYFITLKESLLTLWKKVDKQFPIQFKNKIIYGEDLISNTKYFCVSLHLYIACLLKLGAKQIILFGADGSSKDNTEQTYYKSNLVLQDRKMTGNAFFNVIGDTNNINCSFEPLMRSALGYVPTNVVNCSPNSYLTVFKKVNYNEILTWLKCTFY